MTDLVKLAISKGYDLFHIESETDLIDLFLMQQWLIKKYDVHVNPIAKLDNGNVFYTVSILTIKDDDILYSSYKQALKSGLTKAFDNKL